MTPIKVTTTGDRPLLINADNILYAEPHTDREHGHKLGSSVIMVGRQDGITIKETITELETLIGNA